MEWKEVNNLVLEYFEENMGDFLTTIEELDGWCGYLDNYRRMEMYMIGDYYCDSSVEDIIRAALDGSDQYGSHFDPEREYFYWDSYNSLISTDDLDYEEFLDSHFIKKLYEYHIKLKLRNQMIYGVPDYVTDLFDKYYAETGEKDVWNQHAW